MKCPACQHELSRVTVAEIEVDVCKGGCGGLWFNNYELQKFDEPHEHLGEALLDIDTDPNVQVDHNQRRQCPKCENITMLRHFFSTKKKVELDECPGCAGIWLDNGELKSIRGLYKTEQEKIAAAEQYFDEVLGAQILNLQIETEAKLEKQRRFAHMFRFICPSYYIPGKQDGGAF